MAPAQVAVALCVFRAMPPKHPTSRSGRMANVACLPHHLLTNDARLAAADSSVMGRRGCTALVFDDASRWRRECVPRLREMTRTPNRHGGYVRVLCLMRWQMGGQYGQTRGSPSSTSRSMANSPVCIITFSPTTPGSLLPIRR